jgi:hypothetical protein
VLAAMLFTDSKGEVNNILAPDIVSNPTLGPGGTLRYLDYARARESDRLACDYVCSAGRTA